MKYRVGIYGGMGCGKSTVIDELRRAGASVLVSDEVNASLASNPDYVAGVTALCPAAAAEGGVNKVVLRRWVLADESHRLALMSLAHPLIRRSILAQSAEGLWFVELSVYVPDFIPLDEAWQVVCSPDVQMQRILFRGGWSREDAMRMVAAQNENGVAPDGAVRIDNDGNEAELRATVRRMYRELLSRT